MKIKMLLGSILMLSFLIGFISSSAGEAPPGMVLVKGGTFMMGTDEDNKYMAPIHSVTLDGFCIGKFEVTQEEWQRVMGSNPSFYKGGDHPVEQVSWYDAVAYCNQRSEKEGLTPCYSGSGDDIVCDFAADGYRLPTEAEWEYACVGGSRSRGFIYSGSNEATEVAWYEENSAGKPHSVGKKQPNELGTYDMTGNVWEWCWDWYGDAYYENSPAANPRGPEKGERRSYRGGGCSGIKHYMYSRHRDGLEPSYKETDMGFRIVKKLGPKGEIPAGMVAVESGTLQMGSNNGRLGLCPAHEVTVNDFFMGKCEVTQEEFTAAMGYNPAWFSAAYSAVDCVRWFEAVEYCNKRSEMEGLTPCYSGKGDNITCNFNANGYRLPTEAEWEYACQGGAQSRHFKYSGSDEPEEVAWFVKNLSADRRTRRGGMKKSNELGLYDMTGNAWEWCWDRFDRDYYWVSPKDNPLGPSSGIRRVVRGGSIYHPPFLPSFRYNAMAIVGWQGFGFRVVRTAK